MKKFILLALLMCVSAGSVNAQSRLVTEPVMPYDTLGTIEEKISTKHCALKLLTFGIVRRRSYEGMVKKLNRTIEKNAYKRYGADAVTGMTYWPSVEDMGTVDYLYARGEMIRYKKFGEDAVTPSIQAAAPTPPADSL